MDAHSHSLAAYLIACGHKVEGARIDSIKDAAVFVFNDVTDEDVRSYRQVIGYLNALSNIARTKLKLEVM
jgi:hypothetical protein